MYDVENKSQETAVDWLTVYTPKAVVGHQLLELAWDARDDLPLIAGEAKPFETHGLTGWRLGGIELGISDKVTRLSLSGERAAQWMHRLLTLDVRCSRIDLAVTVVLGYPVPLASLEFRRLAAKRDEPPGEGYKTNYSLITGSDDGSTLYLGIRGKRRFARLYDKGVQAQTHDPALCWRYEVEFRSLVADKVWLSLTEASDKAALIQGLVWKHFADRGVGPVWSAEENPVLARYSGNSDPLKTLTWLSRQVHPAIDRLRFAGYEMEVYNSLGLQDWLGDYTQLKED